MCVDLFFVFRVIVCIVVSFFSVACSTVFVLTKSAMSLRRQTRPPLISSCLVHPRRSRSVLVPSPEAKEGGSAGVGV